MPDIEFAHTVLLVGVDPREDAPILDLRIRKGVRRNGVQLAIATARPTALEQSATVSARYAPGGDAEFLAALDRGLAGDTDPTRPLGETLEALTALLRDGGSDVVILYSERIGAAAAATLRRIAERLSLKDSAGAGLIAIPAGANGRGLREAGVVPDAGPGYAALTGGVSGRGATEIGHAAAAGEITALYLVQTDPVREMPDRGLWERAMAAAPLVVAHATVLTEGLREHATVVFPAESHAEKDGTVVHPDGRLQRLRIAIQAVGEVRPGWAVIAHLAQACGVESEIGRSEHAFDRARRRGPLLRRAHARGDRRPGRALAGAPRGHHDVAGRLGSHRAADPARRGTRRADGHQRPPRAGHLPAAVGLTRGRDLARAPVPDRPPARRALTRRRLAARDRRR